MLVANNLKSVLAKIPHEIGVYLFYNKDEQIIYVGKAKNLFKRVNQYFLDGSHKGVFFHRLIAKIDYILVKNEKEAFLLEINLIKKHLPRFNIIFKDNKTYPYICVIEKNKIVKLEIKRNQKKPSSNCFGPYPYGTKILKIIHLLNNIFKVKKCKNKIEEECLYSQMNQCLHLNKKDSIEYYKKIKILLINFLKGNDKNIIKKIEEKMFLASTNQDYELANDYKDIIAKIKSLKEEQKIVSNNQENSDYISWHWEDIYILFYIIKVRNGKIVLTDYKSYEFIQEPKDAMQDFINGYYKKMDLPDTIFCEFLDLKCFDSLIKVPLIGKRKKLLNLAKQNAILQFEKEKNQFYKFASKEKIWGELALVSKLKKITFWEIYDASHTMGDEYVGYKIEFNKSGINKNRNRKYNLNKIKVANDGLAFEKMIEKRFSHDLNIPDLIIVDGGMIQINAVKRQLAKQKIIIKVMGLIKDNKHKTSHLIDDKGKKVKTSKKLFLYLANCQSQIHDLAISYHTTKRRKKIVSSFLDNVKGVGDKRKMLLLNYFKSYEGIRKAKKEELAKIVGIKIANEIKKVV